MSSLLSQKHLQRFHGDSSLLTTTTTNHAMLTTFNPFQAQRWQ